MQTVMIIGAGFSCPFGLPLASQVITWLWRRWQADDENPFLTETKAETEFWINQARACAMHGDSVDFEGFLAFLESAESLWGQLNSAESFPRCPNNWPDYLPWPTSPGSLAEDLKTRFLDEIRRFHDPRLGGCDFFRPAIEFFRRHFQAGDSVLTFNFDSIVEDSLFYGLGSGNLSEGKPNEDKVSVYHLHGAAVWMLYELSDHKDEDPESTIHLFQKQNKTWKLRKTAGEYNLNPFKSHTGLQAGAVQMVPYKSIPWFLTSQWEHGLASLRQADSVIVIGYSFPFHDGVARFAIRTALNTNSRAKILNIDPRAGDKKYQQALIRLLGRHIEFIPKSWCDIK